MSETYRRYARLQTRKVATLSLEGGQVLDCEIRDFCPEGVLLLPLPGRDGSFAANARQIVGSNGRVSFTRGDRGTGHTLTFAGKLVRATPDSIGVFTEEMPRDAYKALATVRTDLLNSEQVPGGILPTEGQAILHDCVNCFRLFLSRVWQQFLEQIGQRLLEGDASPLPLSDHSRFLSALRDLSNRGGEKGQDLYRTVVERMRRLEQDGQQTLAPAGEDGELDFVDEGKFEDWLNIAAVFNRQEVEIRTPMYEFAQRFQRLLPVPVDKSNDPFGPEVLCLAFQDVIRDVDLSNPMRAIVYAAFGRAIEPDYPELYRQLNQLLAPLKPVAAGRTRASQTTGQTAASEQVPGAPADGGDMANQLARLAEVADRLMSFASPRQDPPGPGAPAGESAPAGIAAAGIPVETTGQVLHRPAPAPEQALAALQSTLGLLSQRLSVVESRSAAQPPSPPEAATTPVHDIEQLLGQAGHLPAGSFSLSRQMASLLADPAATINLPSTQVDRLGLLTNLMKQASGAQPETSQIDALLVKLERPLYQAALRGDDVLRQKAHPLRRLFNLVERFAIVADDNGQFIDPELHKLVDSIVDRVATQADYDEAMLSYVCENLEKLLRHPMQQHGQRIATYQELCEGQRNQQRARVKVAAELDRRLAGREVPALLLRLLDTGWRQHLILLQLRGDGEATEAALAVLDSLAGMLSDGQAMTAAKLALTDQIGQGLNATSVDTLQTDVFLEELRSALINAASSDSETMRVPAEWFSAQLDPKRSLHDEENAGLERPRIGEWWDFRAADRKTPMQLIWSSQDGVSLAFVNRSATRKSEVTLAEFHRQLKRGDVVKADNKDLPLLERSEYGVVDAAVRNLAYESARDAVTGLLNWKGWLKAIKAAQASAPGAPVGHQLCLLEFYPLQLVYDSLGVEAGERMLRTLAGAVKDAVGEGRPITAIRDGVFAVFLPRHSHADARRVVDTLLNRFAGYHFEHGAQKFRVSLGIGLAESLLGPDDVEATLHRATTACNIARSQGGNRLQVYEDQGELLREREKMLAWAGDIDRMLSDDVLYLRCQQIAPIGAKAPGRPYYEILLGINRHDGEEVSPQSFVNAVEMCKRTRDLDLWVAGRAFRWIRDNPDVFAATGGFSINLSAASLADAGVLAALEAELGKGDLPAEKIMFEITETATLRSYGAARDFIHRLRRHGCKFCIDDFGSGNASYGYLKNLRTDTLKIDGAYVKDILSDPYDLALVKSMNDIGHSLGMRTVAEYASSAEILAALQEIGVDYVQGFAIHKPTPLDALLASG